MNVIDQELINFKSLSIDNKKEVKRIANGLYEKYKLDPDAGKLFANSGQIYALKKYLKHTYVIDWDILVEIAKQNGMKATLNFIKNHPKYISNEIVEDLNKIDQIIKNTILTGDCKKPIISDILGINIKCNITSYDIISDFLGSELMEFAIIKNISLLFPQYSYGSLTLEFKNEKLVSELFTIKHIGNLPYVLIIVITHDLDEEDKSHEFVLFINREEMNIEYFDSSISDDYIIDALKKSINKNIYGKFNFIYANDSCFNIQRISDDYYCQTWSILFIFIKLYIPNISVNIIYKYFLKMNRIEMIETIEKFMICVYWKISTHIERYIGVSILIFYECDKMNYKSIIVKKLKEYRGFNSEYHIDELYNLAKQYIRKLKV